MEIKVNKEIREYSEHIFFGLSLRQFFFSVFAAGVAVGLYFLLRGILGIETLSWLCILGAAPFAALGFIRYNGMTAEQFLWAYIKSEWLYPKRLAFGATDLFALALHDNFDKRNKKGEVPHVQDTQAVVPAGSGKN